MAENEHWAGEFEHASVTADNREAFNTVASKFPTQGDMCVGYMELQKTAGKPFKMPESMDKLPDDATRSDFTAQANKLLGNEFVADTVGLIDLDLKMGSKTDTPTDEAFANKFKQFVVDKKYTKAHAQELIGFYNEAMGDANEAFTAAEDATFDTNAKATNEGLVTHFGSQDKVDSESEFFRRAVLNHPGMTTERAEKVADIFVEVMQRGGSDAAVTLLEMIAPMAREGGTHAGTGGNKTETAKTTKEQLPKTGAALGW